MSAVTWFLGFHGQVLARNSIELDLSWPGPSTGWFALRPIEFESTLLAGHTARPFTDSVTQVLHTLATAMRALSLFAEAYGAYPDWSGDQEVQLLYMARAVPPNRALNAWYDGSTMIEFDYVEGGPWSCLSHDIVIHETCHAILHRRRLVHKNRRTDRCCNRKYW